MDGFRLLFATSGPTKRRKHYLCLLFSQYWTWVDKKSMLSALLRKINSGTTTPGTASKNQCHNFGTFRLKLLKLYKKRPTCFQTLTFCRNLGFQKPWICPWICPWIFHGFPTPWPGSLGRALSATPWVPWIPWAPKGSPPMGSLGFHRVPLGVHFLSAAPAASPKIHGVGNPWKIRGKSMDTSRVFGNSDFGKKSRFENKLVVFRKVLKV